MEENQPKRIKTYATNQLFKTSLTFNKKSDLHNTTCLRETIGTKKKENLQKSVVQSETKLTQVNCQKPLPIRSKININQLFEKTSHQANRLQQFRLI